MSVQDLTNAIVTGINAGAEQFLEGTLAAVLPIIWLAILGLHLGRPYILEMIDRFTLRLGADLLWLVYVALRDLLIVSGVVMSFMFFFPDVVTTDALPLTGGLAAAALFGVLLVKLMGYPDHNLRDFRLVGCGYGLILTGQATGQLLTISNFLVTSSNPGWAIGIAYVSIGLLAIMGAIAAGYTLRTGGQPEITETASADSPGAI